MGPLHAGSLRAVCRVARAPRRRPAQLLCGAVAGPLFAGACTAIGATRAGYDWRRLPVSSLTIGRSGWLQRVNFLVAGVLYSCAARGLRCSPSRRVGPRAVAALVAGAGMGLIGSGMFVTDPVGGFPGETSTDHAGRTAPTPAGQLHNLSAIPIFAGIPVAGMASAATALRHGDWRWASYSAASSLAMVGTFLLFASAFGTGSRVGRKGGLFQRLSIGAGFGWLTALSLRALSSSADWPNPSSKP